MPVKILDRRDVQYVAAFVLDAGHLHAADRRLPRDVRRVVLPAQMREHEALRAVFIQLRQQLRAGDVRKVPAFGEDPALERIRVRPRAQHADVVVRLDHREVDAQQVLFDLGRDRAEVGRHGDGLAVRSPDAEAEAFRTVVRRAEGAHAHAAELQLPLDRVRRERAVEHAHGFERRQRTGRRKNRDIVFGGKNAQAAHVVGMLVRYENAADGQRVDAAALQNVDGLARATPHIDQKARRFRADKIAVSRASAVQRPKLRHRSISLLTVSHKKCPDEDRRGEGLRTTAGAGLSDFRVAAVLRVDAQIHVCAEPDKLLHNVLVAALDVLDLFDLRRPSGRERRNDHRRACTQVDRAHRRALEILDALDDRALALDRDLRAHALELLDIAEAVLPDVLVQDARALREREHRRDLRLHIGREARVRHRLHVAFAQRTVPADADRVVVLRDGDAHLHQLRRNGFQMLRRDVLDQNVSAGRRNGGHICSGLDLVRNDRIRDALQMLDAADLDDVGAGAADVRAHRVQEVREVDDVRLARRVLDDRQPLRLHGRQNDVHRRADRDHVEVNVRAAQLLCGDLDHAVVERICAAQRIEALDVLVNRPNAEITPAGQRDNCM